MAQTGFMLSDEGRTITVTNGSSTTAITAGDICYAPANDDVMTGTAATARAAFTGADIKAKSCVTSVTGYQTALGVAIEDIPASGIGAVALEGVFLNPAAENVEAGNVVQGMEATTATLATSNKVQVADSFDHKIGKALTGGSADGKYIVWKLAL